MQYAAKATEYAAAAEAELVSGRFTAATSLAVHAAICASDAVCGARLGVRSVGERHQDVLDLLRRAGPDGVAIDVELRRLLPLKNGAEYEPDEVSHGTASRAVSRARRCAEVARVVASKLR